MIDVDNSGTIEAAEFIGPLSRWVHDSKTAPRWEMRGKDTTPNEKPKGPALSAQT